VRAGDDVLKSQLLRGIVGRSTVDKGEEVLTLFTTVIMILAAQYDRIGSAWSLVDKGAFCAVSFARLVPSGPIMSA